MTDPAQGKEEYKLNEKELKELCGEKLHKGILQISWFELFV